MAACAGRLWLRLGRVAAYGGASLDGARGETADDEALPEDDEQQGGQEREHDAGEDHARVVGVELCSWLMPIWMVWCFGSSVTSSGQKYMFQADRDD